MKTPILAALGLVALMTACSDGDKEASTSTTASTSSVPARSESTVTVGTDRSVAVTSTFAPAASVTTASAAPASSTSGPAARQQAPTIAELLTADHPLVIAHTGGEDEFPGSTMFAFGESVKAGVDMLDLNVLLSSDGVLVVQHDETVERTSNGSGSVEQMTAAQLGALDNAYWFTTHGLVDDRPADEYIFRGVRTGEVPPPAGYTADDFGIPTLEQVLDRFPEMPLGIEIKGAGQPAQRAADALLGLLEQRGHLASTVISSFDDATIDYVHAKQPQAILSPGVKAMTAWVLNSTPLPNGMTILQLPPFYGENDSIEIITDELIARSHDAGYVIWIWPNNRKFENASAYQQYVDRGIDGLNINFPTEAMEVVEGRTS